MCGIGFFVESSPNGDQCFGEALSAAKHNETQVILSAFCSSFFSQKHFHCIFQFSIMTQFLHEQKKNCLFSCVAPILFLLYNAANTLMVVSLIRCENGVVNATKFARTGSVTDLAQSRVEKFKFN